MSYPLPAQEVERLKALQALDLLDSGREAAFDDLVQLAAEWCGVPVAAISLIDVDRQWFKACCGLNISETPREQSFCTHAIVQPHELLQVRDTRLDPRFADNPLVTGAPHVRFYAGAPLLTTEGHALGALCVIDSQPRELTASQIHALEVLARQVGLLIELRSKRARLEQQERSLRISEARLRGVTDNVPAVIAYVDGQQRVQFCNRKLTEWCARPESEVLGHTLHEVLGEAEYARHREHVEAALQGQRREFGLWALDPEGGRFFQFSHVPDCLDGSGPVQGFFVLASDLTAMKQLELKLAAEARFDTLTGLPNRRHFHEQLEQGLLRAQRHGSELALGFLDLDGFKQINDRHGHAIGDAVLQEFGRRLRQSLRQTDFVARLAGDEFTVLLEDVQRAHELDALAQKILAAVRQPFVLAGGLQLAVRTSLGLALAVSGEGAEALMARADAAMYRVKSEGRDAYVIVQA
ncbi:diguanylate cyclase [Paucibacter sp. DJ1R-11]|uniref:diguanylate cyclase domain-containing protein n=1 Tax=Paucibacter sp. DJ1R-11 TaxID=2893556 RepID=UPI0021E3F5D9|nr:diguanylate cyclase [Paucibacter sp. DJ1R-11]MCV2362662.1 diguanylate cyclase [Paucibacter sp. DJ1R-11]